MRFKSMLEEKLPISEKLKVLDSVNLYKTNKWWSAIALIESFGRKQIALYVWLNKEGKWKRNQKFVIHNKAEWNQVKEVVDKFIAQLG
ncbi:MAG: hypothetical protein QW228_07050 [Candidatus Aenigmatarchaeota archaeon]